MASYIVNHTQRARPVEYISFTQEDTTSLNYLHYDALVVG